MQYQSISYMFLFLCIKKLSQLYLLDKNSSYLLFPGTDQGKCTSPWLATNLDLKVQCVCATSATHPRHPVIQTDLTLSSSSICTHWENQFLVLPINVFMYSLRFLFVYVTIPPPILPGGVPSRPLGPPWMTQAPVEGFGLGLGMPRGFKRPPIVVCKDACTWNEWCNLSLTIRSQLKTMFVCFARIHCHVYLYWFKAPMASQADYLCKKFQHDHKEHQANCAKKASALLSLRLALSHIHPYIAASQALLCYPATHATWLGTANRDPRQHGKVDSSQKSPRYQATG